MANLNEDRDDQKVIGIVFCIALGLFLLWGLVSTVREEARIEGFQSHPAHEKFMESFLENRP